MLRPILRKHKIMKISINKTANAQQELTTAKGKCV